MNRTILTSLLVLAVGAFTGPASAQTYDCLATGGTDCRELIPDTNGTTSLESIITVTPSGACTTESVSRVLARVNVLHDWIGDVSIELVDPSGAVDVMRTGSAGLSSTLDDLHELYLVGSLTGGPAAGDWTLRLTDLGNSGTGALDNWTLYLVCGAVPAVSITTALPLASESPLTTGSFVVTRSVVTADPLDVALAYSGSALFGVDYAALPAVVTIPANQASVTITVTPIADAIAELPETVVASIVEPILYTIGSPASATVQITDLQAQPVPLDAAGMALLIGLLAVAGALMLRRQLV